MDLDGGGGADGGGLVDRGVLLGGRLGVQQDDDAVLVTLVENLGGDQDALTGGAALVFVEGDVHGFLLLWGFRPEFRWVVRVGSTR
ncbi:hypothetical protein GCM10010361_23550 [Streptomyces olivaceiscleroticus]|uniref:Uncharacterized protein n=1 Tax=Streptomyces olivaceiscleroticus TaxID=68245 RepID=A0ABN0ZTV2_9ACTN